VAVRLADLLAGLSRLADLGFGLEAGAALRSCLLAARLARRADASEADVRAAYYTALLHHVGCVGYAHETQQLFGNEHLANTAAGRTDLAAPLDLFTTFLPVLTQSRPPRDRLRLTAVALSRGGRWGTEFTTAACEVGRDSARRLGLSDSVQSSLFHVYDLWRGRTRPGEPHGPDIPFGARVARLTGVAVLFHLLGGRDSAVGAVRRRSGGMLDPGLVAHFVDHAKDWLAETEIADVTAEVLAAEPRPWVTVTDERQVATVFGDLADLVSPYLLGHARGVAELAVGAARELGMSDEASGELELAGLLHDVGRVAVSSAVWDKPGRLSADEWEQVRLHPYHSERILAASPSLARLAPVVGRHHERLDGSGYHRGCTAKDLAVPARILAAAESYRTSVEPRPHRPALAPRQAAQRLLAEAGRGALDRDAVSGVLVAAGHRPTVAPRRDGRQGLSAREVDVLRLVARGCSNAEIASRLVISRRTAEHHVQHIYTKIGVSSRAAAALFAVEHDLLCEDG
jgi:HD-GYP domain-containing protein (c-di-GMP phosphodiesterase class II)/DNA-binding CsgD family transcriptional regulator